MNKIIRQQGFSLVELMIGIAISVIIAYGVFTVMRVSGNQVNTADNKMSMQDSAREGLYKMAQEIRLSAPGHCTVVDDGAALEFDVPDAGAPTNDDSEIDWDSSHQIRYEVSDGQLLRIVDGDVDNATVLANDVARVNFSADDVDTPEKVLITLGHQRTLASGQALGTNAAPMEVSLTVQLRNPADSGGEGAVDYDIDDDDSDNDDDNDSNHEDEDDDGSNNDEDDDNGSNNDDDEGSGEDDDNGSNHEDEDDDNGSNHEDEDDDGSNNDEDDDNGSNNDDDEGSGEDDDNGSNHDDDDGSDDGNNGHGNDDDDDGSDDHGSNDDDDDSNGGGRGGRGGGGGRGRR